MRFPMPPTYSTRTQEKPESNIRNQRFTLRQNLERAVEVPREPRVQIVRHVVGVDLDVSRRMDKHQPEISAA